MCNCVAAPSEILERGRCVGTPSAERDSNYFTSRGRVVVTSFQEIPD